MSVVDVSNFERLSLMPHSYTILHTIVNRQIDKKRLGTIIANGSSEHRFKQLNFNLEFENGMNISFYFSDYISMDLIFKQENKP